MVTIEKILVILMIVAVVITSAVFVTAHANNSNKETSSVKISDIEKVSLIK